MSLTHPPIPSPASTHPVIGYYKDSVSGEVSKWQFPRVQLFAVPTDVPGRYGLFPKNWNFIETDCVSHYPYVYRGSRCGERFPYLWISYKLVNFAFPPLSLKMYELRFPFSETNIGWGRCISIVSPRWLDIFGFPLLPRCESMA